MCIVRAEHRAYCLQFVAGPGGCQCQCGAAVSVTSSNQAYPICPAVFTLSRRVYRFSEPLSDEVADWAIRLCTGAKHPRSVHFFLLLVLN